MDSLLRSFISVSAIVVACEDQLQALKDVTIFISYTGLVHVPRVIGFFTLEKGDIDFLGVFNYRTITFFQQWKLPGIHGHFSHS